MTNKSILYSKLNTCKHITRQDSLNYYQKFSVRPSTTNSSQHMLYSLHITFLTSVQNVQNFLPLYVTAKYNVDNCKRQISLSVDISVHNNPKVVFQYDSF
jgi:hypothetical protein